MRYNKDNLSTARLEFRLTVEEKQKITDYCVKHNMSMSDFVRMACQMIFDKEENFSYNISRE